MKLLLTANKAVLLFGTDIEFGIWDEPSVSKWKVTLSIGEGVLYAIDNGYTVAECNDDDIPEDIAMENYVFTDGAFVANSEWVKPMSIEEELMALKQQVIMLTNQMNRGNIIEVPDGEPLFTKENPILRED